MNYALHTLLFSQRLQGTPTSHLKRTLIICAMCLCVFGPRAVEARHGEIIPFPSLSGGLSLREGFFLEGGLTVGKSLNQAPAPLWLPFLKGWGGLDGPALSAQVGTRSSTLTAGWGTLRLLIPPLITQSIVGVAYNKTYSGEDRVGVRARVICLLVGLSVGVYWPIANQSTGSPLFNVGFSLGI